MKAGIEHATDGFERREWKGFSTPLVDLQVLLIRRNRG
jgi:hypothetical protein